MVRFLLLFIGPLILLPILSAQPAPGGTSGPFSLEAGVSPNSLDTVGENLSLSYRPLPFVELTAQGLRQRLADTDYDFEKYDGPASGDISKDILLGEVGIGLPLHLGVFSAKPSASIVARGTDAYTVGRLLGDSVDGYPEDTFCFFDERSSELIVAGSGGLSLALSIGGLGLGAEAYYVPFGRSRLKATRFLTKPSIPVGQTTAAYYWDERVSDTLFDCSGYGASARLHYSFPRLGMSLELEGTYRIFSYSGDSEALRQVWWAVKPDLTTIIQQIVTDQAISSTVSVDDGALEFSGAIRFAGLRQLLKLPGEPVVKLAWVRTVKTYLYSYAATSGTSASRETWTEALEYFTYTLGWGF